MVAAGSAIEPRAKIVEHANLFETSYGHQNTEEEENRWHIQAWKEFGHTLLHTIRDVVLIAIEEFGRKPEHAQNKQDAHKRRKVGQVTEDGDEKQTTYAKEEDYLTLRSREVERVAFSSCLRLG